MPVLMVSSIRFLENYRIRSLEDDSDMLKEEDLPKGYCIDILDLIEIFPNIKAGKDVDIFLIEFMDEKNETIKKFELFKKPLSLKIKCRLPREYFICLPPDISDELGIGQNYKVAFIITKYDNKPLASESVSYTHLTLPTIYSV